MAIENQIKERLEKAFSPTQLNIINQSHLHAGHAGDDGSGESHFKVEIAAPVFDDLSRIDRERAIHKALGDLMRQIHALSIIIHR